MQKTFSHAKGPLRPKAGPCFLSKVVPSDEWDCMNKRVHELGENGPCAFQTSGRNGTELTVECPHAMQSH